MKQATPANPPHPLPFALCQLAFCLFITLSVGCKTAEPMPCINSNDIRAEVLAGDCLPYNGPGEVRINISNHGTSVLKFNPGFFELVEVFDDKNASVPAHATICTLLSISKDWYTVGKDSTVSIPVRLTGLHKFTLEDGRKYSLGLAYYPMDERGHLSKHCATHIALRSRPFEICR